MAPFAGSARFVMVMGAAGAGAMALLGGCNEKLDQNVAKVELGGKQFFLEIVADDDKRYLGMGKREADLEEDGGMLFVFPNNQVSVKSFVMRDCKFDLDIIFLDSAGRILAMHNMKAEPPRQADEMPEAPGGDEKYNDRLKKYPSRFATQFVIEIKGGMLQSLNLKEGELVKQNWEELKKMAR